MSLALKAKIKLDDGDRLVALVGIATATKMYDGRIIAVDDIQREISVQPGEFRAAEITLELDDSDNFFSDIRTAEPLLGRTLEVLLFDPDTGESDDTVIAAGSISGWSATANTFTITAEDLGLDRLDQVIDDRIDPTKFPDVPDETPRELVPLVIGLVSSAGTGQSNTGAIPCYLVDPAISQAKYQYVACQREVRDIPNVYVYGVVTVSGFTVQTRTLGGKTYTTIEFTADQRDVDRSNELEITCDVDGITDDGTSSGNRIANPADLWQEVLLQTTFVAGDIDSTSVTTARNSYAARNITGGFAAIDKGETLREIAEKFATSFNLTTFATRGGKFGVTTPEPGAAPAAGQVTFDESTIARDSLTFGGSEDLASSIDYFYAKNWHLGTFDVEGQFSDALQVSRLNRDVRLSIELPYVYDTTSASAVINDKAFFLSDNRVVVQANADLAELRNVDVGDTVTLKHYGGFPFSAESFRVLGSGLAFDGANMLLALSLVDISQTAFTVGIAFKALREQPDLIRTNFDRPRRPGVGVGVGIRWG